MMTSTTMLAAHFSAGELTRDRGQLGAFLWAVTPHIEANLYRLASGLEAIRAVLGVPMKITSGFRPPFKNDAVGGATSSSHLDGLAADFVPVGLSQYAAYRALQRAPLPAWDQIIYYPIQGHIHVGYGAQLRREVRINLSSDPGGTPILAGSLVERLQGYGSSLADAATDIAPARTWLAVGIGALVLAFLFTSRRAAWLKR